MGKILTITFLSLFLFYSCYYDNEEDLYPVSEINKCDTSNISFSNHIFPIIHNNCNNCHSDVLAPSLGGHISLENYSHIKYSVEEGSLLGSIEYETGYVSMPPEGRIDDCSINKIKVWISNGAEND